MTPQAISDLLHDKPAALAYSMSGFVGGLSVLSAEMLGVVIGGMGVAVTLATNWYYKRKEFQLKKRSQDFAAEADQAKARYYRRRESDK